MYHDKFFLALYVVTVLQGPETLRLESWQLRLVVESTIFACTRCSSRVLPVEKRPRRMSPQ